MKNMRKCKYGTCHVFRKYQYLLHKTAKYIILRNRQHKYVVDRTEIKDKCKLYLTLMTNSQWYMRTKNGQRTNGKLYIYEYVYFSRVAKTERKKEKNNKNEKIYQKRVYNSQSLEIIVFVSP